MLALAFCGSLLASPAVAAKAEELASALTMPERLRLVRGQRGEPVINGARTGAIGSAGYVPGVARLGVPALQETDDSLGVTNPNNVRRGDVATAFPSGLSLASTWDPRLAYRNGATIGDEAWRKGFNVLLGPGLNLTRDALGGRNFEYLGEDPLLAGTLAGAFVCGVQDQHVVATLKHFAMNDRENGRSVYSMEIGPAAMRESDLLAFEIALQEGGAGAVMCAYNRVNGVHACENEPLLDGILKRDWGFGGWVMSDWGAVHGVAAAAAGLDQESAFEYDSGGGTTGYFGAPLSAALASGAIAQSRLLDMTRRILRAMVAVGLFDHPPVVSPIDYAAHARDALDAARRGIVLLKNDGTLPLARSTSRIAVIGGFADAGVLAGGGSSAVAPVDRTLAVPFGGVGAPHEFFDRSPPLAAIRAQAPRAVVSFDDGRYPSAAAALAKRADVAVVFATQWSTEGADLPDLTLPNGQDALIAAVAAANPHTIVVLETGDPVTMPWLDRVSAVVEAWYPGERGGEAIADVLFGNVDATGRLPITFPASQDQIADPNAPATGDVGYRRYAKEGLHPLFAFGHGLSYTTFRYSDLRVTGGTTLTARFDVTNTGSRTGSDTPQLYLTGRAGVPAMRLLGWAQVTLRPGETRALRVVADPRLLADFDATNDDWAIPSGPYQIALGPASDSLALRAQAAISARSLPP